MRTKVGPLTVRAGGLYTQRRDSRGVPRGEGQGWTRTRRGKPRSAWASSTTGMRASCPTATSGPNEAPVQGSKMAPDGRSRHRPHRALRQARRSRRKCWCKRSATRSVYRKTALVLGSEIVARQIEERAKGAIETPADPTSDMLCMSEVRRRRHQHVGAHPQARGAGGKCRDGRGGRPALRGGGANSRDGYRERSLTTCVDMLAPRTPKLRTGGFFPEDVFGHRRGSTARS